MVPSPTCPFPASLSPFRLRPIATFEANGVAANSWEIYEHLGTQIDAPNHFAKDGRSLGADKWALEAVANLDSPLTVGATLS
jgi:kynurenine formamidase